MSKWLERLRPPRLRARSPVNDAQLAEWFANVSDADPCLKGVHELLGRLLEVNFTMSGSLQVTESRRLECARNAYIAHWLMGEIERLRVLGRSRREQGRQG